MKKLLLLLPFLFFFSAPEAAQAQNITCATRPVGDSSNACASTAFVQGAASGNLIATSLNIPLGNESLTVTPYAGNVPRTATLSVKAVSRLTFLTNFLGIFSINCQTGAGQPIGVNEGCVAGYFDANGVNGASQVWGTNTNVAQQIGFFLGGGNSVIGGEINMNNFDHDNGNFDGDISGIYPSSSALVLTAVGGKTISSAISVSGTLINRGIAFSAGSIVQCTICDYNSGAATVIDVRGGHSAYGMDFNQYSGGAVLRLPNNQAIVGRNQLNSADMQLIATDTSNQVNIGFGAGTVIIYGGGTASMTVNPTNTAISTPVSVTGQITSTLAIGTAPFSITSTTLVPNLYVARAQSADGIASTAFANPTASVGLSAVNGTATTALRSDGAPALSQAIVPTWSGIHTFSAAPVFSLGAKYSGSSSGTVTVVASATAGTPTITWGNTSGTPAVTASAPLALSSTTGNLTVTGAAGQVLAGATPAFTATPTLGVAGSTVGSLAFANATSGSVTLQPVVGALGSAVLTIPAATDTIAVLAASQILSNKDLTSGTNTFPTLNQNTTGSAAKWTTPRNLAGNSVDGSGNVAFTNRVILQGTTDAGFSSAQFLGALSTGLVKNTTTTGVLSIATAGTDYLTSVGLSFTGGLISVGSSPLTANGTLALTVAGTSGGIPYFSSTSGWASSALLSANALMIGGGAGTAPATTTTGTGALTALGINVGSPGAFVTNGGALGTPSSGTLSSASGLPISTGVDGLGTNVATALTGGAWVAYTPATPTSTAGTITTASATGRFMQVGKIIFFNMTATITNNGTGSGAIQTSLPVAARDANIPIMGREANVTGFSLQGLTAAASTTLAITKYDNTYPAANGYALVISGTYEAN